MDLENLALNSFGMDFAVASFEDFDTDFAAFEDSDMDFVASSVDFDMDSVASFAGSDMDFAALLVDKTLVVLQGVEEYTHFVSFAVALQDFVVDMDILVVDIVLDLGIDLAD